MRCDDRVHHLLDSDDGIDRAGACAEVAANADGLVDYRGVVETGLAQRRIELERFATEKICELPDRLRASRGAEVDGCAILGDRVRVRPAAGVATLRALNPRQAGFDPVRDLCALRATDTTDDDQRRGQRDGQSDENGDGGKHLKSRKPGKPQECQ